MNYQEITELYRQIGRELHEQGAEKVILVNAKAHVNDHHDMTLEIVLDGVDESEKFQTLCEELWPNVKIQLLFADKEQNRISDYIEDGILL